MTAVRLTPTVWQVGGADGPAATDEYDANLYLVWDGRCGMLIDAGTGRGARRWLDNIVEVTGDLRAVEAVLITHYHADHAGGAQRAAGALFSVLGSEHTVAALLAADEEATSLARARRAGVYPDDYRLVACPSARAVHGPVSVGSLLFDVRPAPGHCDGHVVVELHEPGGVSLFTGDVVFPGGTVSVQPLPDCRLDDYADTLARLAERPVDAIFPGHGPVELDADRCRASLRSAADTFGRLRLPPNFVS